MRRIGTNRFALWSVFLLVHLWLGIVNLYGPGLPLGDVTIVYKYWSDRVFIGDYWVGIHSSWVYPILAIFPMIAAGLFGPAHYAGSWLTLILILDAAAFAALVGVRRPVRSPSAAWWWILFLVLLGPIALGRIDSVTVPLGILGVLSIATRPRVAAAVLTAAAWIKVWPAAIVGAMVVAVKERWAVLWAAVGVSAVIVGVALAFGSGANVLSFVTMQTDRGLQVESPVSTVWLWMAFSGVPGTSLYYDQHLLTWQVTGDGVGAAGALMTPIMGLAVVAIMLIAILAVRRGVPSAALIAPLSLALVCALIAFNKVGSPQFISWLAVPIVLGLATHREGHERWFAIPATLGAIAAGLTQAIYPYLYGWLLSLNPILLVALTARNVTVFVLLGWAVASMWSLGRDTQDDVTHNAEQPTQWPLGAAN